MDAALRHHHHHYHGFVLIEHALGQLQLCNAGLPFAMICKLRTVSISSNVSCCRWTIVWWTVQGVCTFAAVCAAFVFFYSRL